MIIAGMSLTTPLRGAVRLTDWGVIRALGADAATFLHSQLTQDIEGLGQDGMLNPVGYVVPEGARSKYNLYDYRLKNTDSAKVQVHCPLDLPRDVLQRLRALSRTAVRALGLRVASAGAADAAGASDSSSGGSGRSKSSVPQVALDDDRAAVARREYLAAAGVDAEAIAKAWAAGEAVPQALAQQIADPNRHPDLSGVPASIAGTIGHMLAHEPAQRPPATEVMGALVDVVARSGASATDVRQRLTELGHVISPREEQTPEALAAFHKAEIEKWWPIIKAANIKPPE